jgi:hypothetical protein
MEQRAWLYTRPWSREHDFGRLACSQRDGRVCLISDQKVDCGGLAHCGSQRQGGSPPRCLPTFRSGNLRPRFRRRGRRTSLQLTKTPKSKAPLLGLPASSKEIGSAT